MYQTHSNTICLEIRLNSQDRDYSQNEYKKFSFRGHFPSKDSNYYNDFQGYDESDYYDRCNTNDYYNDNFWYNDRYNDPSYYDSTDPSEYEYYYRDPDHDLDDSSYFEKYRPDYED
ncbi:hypothetical protein IJT17_06255 [bacterium]|nr:hypothetical protein [bacterium]